MDQMELYLGLNQAFNSLFRLLSVTVPENYNRPNGNGQWTSGQVADHLAHSARDLLELVKGPAVIRKGPIDKKIPAIHKFLLDNITCPVERSPAPGAGPFDAVFQSDELIELQTGWLEAARTLDPAATCLLFPIPELGWLTRREAGYFNICHFQRYIRQLQPE